MRRLLRWQRLLPAIGILLLLAFATARFYSRSDSAARLVQEKLQARLGVTAEFDRMSVGITETSVEGLRIHEREAPPEMAPFVSVGQPDLDIASIGAIRGASPKSIRFHDAAVLLRFDRNGDLLTRLPKGGAGEGEFPTIQIESGSLTIRQEGRADSVFHGIQLTLTPEKDAVAITGNVEDQAWGKWTASGTIPTAGTKPGQLTFKTAQPQKVTPDLLNQVPFVNPNAWTHVVLSGTTTARLDLTIDPTTDNVSYRIALEPTGTFVNVPSIGLEFADANGKLVAEGSVVTLTDVRGKAADGEVRLDSRMDFGGADSKLRFMADLKNMEVRRLPRNWQLPPQLDGRLSGKVDFTVHLPDAGGTRVEATGKATIHEARLRGQKVPPIELDVQTRSGGGLRFEEPEPIGGKHQAMKPPDEPDPKPKSGRRPGLVSTALKFASRIVKPENAPKEERAYLHVNITFRDVDLSELLKTANVDTPVKVGGKVTVHMQVDIPTETPDEFKAYRLTGSIASRSVSFDELAIEMSRHRFRSGTESFRLGVRRPVACLGWQDRSRRSVPCSGELDVGGVFLQGNGQLEKVALENIERLTSLLPESLRLLVKRRERHGGGHAQSAVDHQ